MNAKTKRLKLEQVRTYNCWAAGVESKRNYRAKKQRADEHYRKLVEIHENRRKADESCGSDSHAESGA